MQIYNALLIHAISTISWVRELKVPSPKAVLTLPHLYCAIQLEITSIQDKFSSNFELSLPPSTLSKKPEWNMHNRMKQNNMWSVISFFLQNTHRKLLRNQGLQLFWETTATYSKGLIAAGLTSNPNREKLHFRVGKCAPDITTDTWWAEPCSWHNL